MNDEQPIDNASRGQVPTRYDGLVGELSGLLVEARRLSIRSVNSIMTATYWLIGRRIVECEQEGAARAAYGERLVERLAEDLTSRFGRGFGRRNLFSMRAFYSAYGDISDDLPIVQTASAQLGRTDGPFDQVDFLEALAARFSLPWSAYALLVRVEDVQARQFYETEALRGGWSVRQLRRQIDSQYYHRALLSKNKADLLDRESQALTASALTEVRDPYVLEFLDLKDEYSENDLEAALISKLETFLLELGPEFTFVGRQRRLRIGTEWYRVDLLFFHRRLRCLVIVDLKLGKFSHGDLGQMHVYLNYARKHWTLPEENPPVGLILCAQKNEALAQYALDNLANPIVAAEYRMALPDEELLAAELMRTQAQILSRDRNED